MTAPSSPQLSPLTEPSHRTPLLPGDDPFNEALLSHLFTRKYESSDVDFKETLDTSHGGPFPKIAKHFFGMSNFGGGFLLIGFRDKPTGGYEPVGLPTSFHLDQAELQGKFNALSSAPLSIGYREFDREVGSVSGRYGVIYVPPSPDLLVPVVDGAFRDGSGTDRIAFRKGEVFIRRGTATERATSKEIEAIRTRSRLTAYRISLISGQPDLIEETLVSNVFLAATLPARVFSCTVDFRGRIPEHGLASCLFRGGTLHTFEDPSRSGVARFIRRGSQYSDPFATWRQDPDRARLLMQLMQSAVVRTGAKLGLLYDVDRSRFYYPLEGQSERREETWPGIKRATQRQVAVRKYLPSLKREVGIHSSARVDFQWLGDQLSLRIEPCFLLTDDGRRPLRGPKQGNVLISLEAWLSSHNGGYLRNVLFWRSKFLGASQQIELAPGLAFDARPLSVQVPVGIREDTMSALEIQTARPPQKEGDEDGYC